MMYTRQVGLELQETLEKNGCSVLMQKITIESLTSLFLIVGKNGLNYLFYFVDPDDYLIFETYMRTTCFYSWRGQADIVTSIDQILEIMEKNNGKSNSENQSSTGNSSPSNALCSSSNCLR